MRNRIRQILTNRDFLALFFLTAFTLAAYLPNLGSYAFWDPWEPHYSQVAKEMGEHDTWMDPWYRGEDRWWSKPILPLWLLRLSFSAFQITGPSDPMVHFAGRLPFVLMSLAGILLTYAWVSRLFNRRAGIYSALVLATSPMYALLAHQVMFDMPFVSMCASATGFYILSRSPQGRPVHLYAFYILTGFAFLSKWLLAFFIPAGVTFAFMVLRWDIGFFRRIGWRHWLFPGLFIVGLGSWFFLTLKDYAFSGMLTACLFALGLMYWMGRDAALEMGASWKTHLGGFASMVAIIAPWHYYMISHHGWPFLREAVIYHHFDRAAGTIGKPEGTFDVFIKQIAFACYPWIALLPAAFVRFLRWNASDFEGEGRRNLWVFLAAAVPYAAFSLFQTKFHHYIFPAVPFIAVMIGVYLSRQSAEDDRAWMRLSMMLSLPVAAVLLLDVLHDYQWFVHLFDYYYGYPLPPQVNPYPFFGVVGAFWLLLLAFLFFRRRISTPVFSMMVVAATATTVLLTAWVIPRVTIAFTQEPLYQAYLKESPSSKAPVAQYNGWLERSVSFYFGSKAEDLSQADQPNVEKAIEFLRRPERSFIILGAGFGRDCKSLLADLRPQVQKRLGKSLYVVFDKHPFSCLVSTERDPEGEQKVKQSVLTDVPPDAQRLDIDFDGKIRLLGYRVTPLNAQKAPVDTKASGPQAPVDRGGSFVISYFFKCTAPVGEDWLVFIHGDGPQGGSHRVFGDHAPLNGLYPTSEWKEGDIIQDDYEMFIPSNYPYNNFTLWMGLWKGNARLPVSQKFQHDGDNRVRTATVQIR